MLHDFASRLASDRADRIQHPLAAEAGAINAFGFHHAVGEEKNEVAWLEVDWRTLAEGLARHKSKRKIVAREPPFQTAARSEMVTFGVPGTAVNERWPVRIQASEEQGDEPTLLKPIGQRPVGKGEDLAGPAVRQRQGPEISLCLGDHERGAHPMAGGIP